MPRTMPHQSTCAWYDYDRRIVDCIFTLENSVYEQITVNHHNRQPLCSCQVFPARETPNVYQLIYLVKEHLVVKKPETNPLSINTSVNVNAQALNSLVPRKLLSGLFMS